MFTAIMSGNEQLIVNIQLIRLFGRDTAIYWTELMNVASKVREKKTFDDQSGLFTLDRAYITDRTTLTTEEQLICEKALVEVGVMYKEETDQNRISLNLEKMLSIITSEDPELLKNVAAVIKKSTKNKSEAKKNAILYNMKVFASDEDADLDTLYKDWVDSVYANKRFLTKKIITQFKEGINNYSTDKETKLELLRIAIASGWTDFTWVQNSYERNTNGLKHKKQKIAKEVNTDITF